MVPRNLATQLIENHLAEGILTPGNEIALRIDQTLTQDATGTLVMLELEALGLDRVRTELSAQYVDHNLLQEDYRNPEDHLFLLRACQRFGVYYSRPGNGVSHPVHQEHFGKPGKTLLGSDSHSCAAGALGMLAIGAGGIEVALAMAGEPFRLPAPEIWGVELTGKLPAWVSAKDVILEMLRRHGVKGGLGRVIEYHGPGVETLSVMDRHVIANMGAELGATATVFPSDGITRAYLAHHGRGGDWTAWSAEEGAGYDVTSQIDLSTLEPLIAMPSSPDNVKPVREMAGQPIGQAYIGSSANPGYRDFAVAAHIVKGHRIPPHVSFDINPTSRGLLESLARDQHLISLIHAGARIHQAGCNGCIGMGQAPATNMLSLRTVPRNFRGRSGTPEDMVCLCSPETAAASALRGVITDPRDLGLKDAYHPEPEHPVVNEKMFVEPLPLEKAREVELTKGINIVALPGFDPLSDAFTLPLLLKVGDNVSTDAIMPAGANVLPYRSNIPRMADFVYYLDDPGYTERAHASRETGHAIVGGENCGQGSSREHAALAPRYLGLRVVIAKSFARIHRQNLVNWGVIPLIFEESGDFDALDQGENLKTEGVTDRLRAGEPIVWQRSRGGAINTRAELSQREVSILLAGGIVNHMKSRVTV